MTQDSRAGATYFTADWAGRLGQFTGTRLEGRIRVTERALNEGLAASAGATVPAIEVQAGNRVVVRYGVLHATAILPEALETGPRPRLTLVLSSRMVAWTLRLTLNQPFVHVHGRHVIVELADVPALAAWREAWPHLRHAGFATGPGLLQLNLSVAVME